MSNQTADLKEMVINIRKRNLPENILHLKMYAICIMINKMLNFFKYAASQASNTQAFRV